MNIQLRQVLHESLGNYMDPKNKARLAMTNKGFYGQLKNNKNIKVSKEYQQIKQAFFLRAFVCEFLRMYDRVRPNTPPPRLLLDISKHMVELYNSLSNAKSKENLLGSIENNIEPRRLFVMFWVNLSIKLKKIDKILTNFIADGVKKIRNLSKNKNHLLKLLYNDHHFKSNPDAVFKTLTKVHDRSGQRGLAQRKVSGNRTLRIVRSMIGGLNPLDYIENRKWTFNQYSPIAYIVDLGKVGNTNQSFVKLLSPKVSKKSVKKFLSAMQFKNGKVAQIRVNNTNNGVNNTNNGFIGRNFISLGNSSNNNNNIPTNNNNNITRLNKTLRMNRNKVNENIAKMYPNFNKIRNTVPREQIGPLLQGKEANRRKLTKNKGKMPMGINGNNYYNYLKSKN